MDIQELKELYSKGERNFQKVNLSIPNIDELLAKINELEMQKQESFPQEVLENMVFKQIVIDNEYEIR
ncbi:hypothetical protein VB713_02750 [Anabaena cylindrica UHCC 0172]|nr:hypothetical protein [Anabaena cylindrica UHCC 0172]